MIMKKKVLSLQEHQNIIYELLYVLDDFCKENDIKYFLGYGTLLGAVRHQGIIPWDDDADVMMEREEYERFQKLIIANPPKGYEAYSIYNRPDYFYPFIKFGKKGTLLLERLDYAPTERIELGINIDIFPIDGCPGETREQACFYGTSFFPRYLSIQQEWFKPVKWKDLITWKEKIAYLLYFPTRLSFVRKMYFKKMFQNATKYSCKETKYFSCIFWDYNGARSVHECSAIKTLQRTPFGNRLLPVPSGYDQLLREEYGDYMVPPNEKDRVSTHDMGDVYQLERNL